MSDKYNHHTMPLPKPKGVPRAMTREQIALYAEWDPSLLQSNADEHTSPVRQPQQQTMSIMRKQKGNASGSPKPYSPSTFEEWKAAASVAHPTGTRENIASPSTAAGNSAGRTVTGQPSSRYGCREMGVQGEAHAGSDAWRHRSSFSSNAAQADSPSMVYPQRTRRSFVPVSPPMKPQPVTETNVSGIISRVEEMDIDGHLSSYCEPKGQISPPKYTASASTSIPASPQRKTSTAKRDPPNPSSSNNNTSRQTSNLANKGDTGSKEVVEPQPVQYEGTGFAAPNGLFINDEELARLSNGVKLSNGDLYYFRPSFVTDPWVGLKPIKISCLRRY